MDYKNHQNLNCWVITEGIAGTENQCIGVAEALGTSPIIKRVDLRFPWKQLTPYFRIANKYAFSKKSDPITPPWPDIAICSGRKSIPAALYIKKASKEKTLVIQIQDPRCTPSLFDLVFLPSHDPTRGKNVITTTGSLNRITQEKLTSESKKFPPFFKNKKPAIAVLIGGNSKSHTLTKNITKKLSLELKNLAVDYNIMVTASRRTDDENRSLLKESLGNDESIYFWDGSDKNPYFAFLDRAEKILVTSDSASMISEAITSGKPTYIIPLEGGGKRINTFHEEIIKNNHATEFEDGILQDFTPTPLKETERVAKIIAQTLKNR